MSEQPDMPFVIAFKENGVGIEQERWNGFRERHPWSVRHEIAPDPFDYREWQESIPTL